MALLVEDIQVWLAEKRIVISVELLQQLPDEHLDRLRAFLSGERGLPRIMWPFRVSDFDETALVDAETWTPVTIAEEVIDALMTIGLTFIPPGIQLAVTNQSDDRLDALFVWLEAVAVVANSNMQRVAGDYLMPFPEQPAIIRELLYPNEQKTVTQSVEPTVDAAVEPASPTVEPDAAIDAAPVTNVAPASYVGETRAAAIERLGAEFHIARERLREKQRTLAKAKLLAKAAADDIEDCQVEFDEIADELDRCLHDSVWSPMLPFDRNEGLLVRDGDSITIRGSVPISAPTAIVAEGSAAVPRTTDGPDPAKTASIEQLREHGATAGAIEKLLEKDIAFVCDLENAIASGTLRAGWIKGVGQTAIDKLSDAIVSWRQKVGYGT